MQEPSAFEEYKMLVELTDRMTTRRQQNSTLFVSVHGLLLTAVAFMMGPGAQSADQQRFVGVSLLMSVGVTLCVLWYLLIDEYRRVLAWRFSELRELERVNSDVLRWGIWTRERAYFVPEGLPRRKRGFSRLERTMPITFGAIYLGVWGFCIARGVLT